MTRAEPVPQGLAEEAHAWKKDGQGSGLAAEPFGVWNVREGKDAVVPGH